MGITAVFFDLDGTLLPMAQGEFVKAYFGLLAKKLAPHGYDPKKLVDAIWTGTAAMVQNDGACTNEAVFWQTFANIFGPQAMNDIGLFEEFYAHDFDNARSSCGYSAKAAQVVRTAKKFGCRAVLATNPIFPAVATQKRIAWAGLEASDFELYTTYENSRFCKPNLNYYRDLLKTLDIAPQNCLMVGNDVSEDMVARELGMAVFLLTDCMINKNDEDISQYPHGDFDALESFIRRHAEVSAQ